MARKPTYAQHVAPGNTPQSEPLLGENQVRNNAGGFVYAIDDWQRLERFLILGAEGGTYYTGERKLTRENAEVVNRCLKADAQRTIQTIVAVSEAGRAPKQAPAIFALALAASKGKADALTEADIVERRLALQMLPRVCRIGTDLFAFVDAVKQFRGWGPELRKYVTAWYTGKTPEQAAFQMVKYQQRKGRSHRDVLRLCHAQTEDPKLQAVIRWAIGGLDGMGARIVDRREGGKKEYAAADLGSLPEIIEGFEQIKGCKDSKTAASLIAAYKLPREAVPTQFMNDPVVQEALLPHMKPGALVRSLGPFTASGLLTPFSEASKLVAAKLSDKDEIRKSRIHPINVLVALKLYAQGRSGNDKLTWDQVASIASALDYAFYAAFDNVVPTGKNILIGMDVSGSMSSQAAGLPLSCAEGAAAMAMIVARSEEAYTILAFADTLKPLNITKKDSLTDVLAKTRGINFGGTDCSLPILKAIEKKWPVECFVTITDNETWAGHTHVKPALLKHRAQSGLFAKMAVLAMTATSFTIADPNDPGMMDFVGLDSAVPTVMADFFRG